nr:hypothetical protein [Conexibacter arvalis]
MYAARRDYGHRKKNPFAICTDHKRAVNVAVVQATATHAKRVFDGYAGEGISTVQYMDVLPQATFVAVEENAETASRLAGAITEPGRVEIEIDTARRALLRRLLERPDEKFDLIDLDPFVTCADTIGPALEMAQDNAMMFVTFGGEYRRCFIGSNRKSLAKRYRIHLPEASNAEALEEMPRFMLGELASQAMTQGFLVEPLLVIRYPMIVRAYLRLRRAKSTQSLLDGFARSVVRDERGAYFRVPIPKWRSVDRHHPLTVTGAEAPHVPRNRR